MFNSVIGTLVWVTLKGPVPRSDSLVHLDGLLGELTIEIVDRMGPCLVVGLSLSDNGFGALAQDSLLVETRFIFRICLFIKLFALNPQWKATCLGKKTKEKKPTVLFGVGWGYPLWLLLIASLLCLFTVKEDLMLFLYICPCLLLFKVFVRFVIFCWRGSAKVSFPYLCH